MLSSSSRCANSFGRLIGGFPCPHKQEAPNIRGKSNDSVVRKPAAIQELVAARNQEGGIIFALGGSTFQFVRSNNTSFALDHQPIYLYPVLFVLT